MNCYVKDFGRAKHAVCEAKLPNGFVLTVTEHLKDKEPTPALWARLGALITRTTEVVEAQ